MVGRSLLIMSGNLSSANGMTDEPATPENLIMDYLSSPETPTNAPLSIDSLQREGRSDVLNALVKLGGSAVVAEQLGLDISLFIPRATTNSFPKFNDPETGASITLGRDLERRIETFKAISTPPRENDANQIPRMNKGSGPQRRRLDEVPTAEELLQQRLESEQQLKQKAKVIVSEGETLTLSTDIRIGFILLAATAAVGFGRASTHTVDASVVAVCQALATGLLAAHVSLAFYAVGVLAPRRKRGPTLWFIKTLLGGPLAVRALRALPVNSSD